jgi:hypothetical protein
MTTPIPWLSVLRLPSSKFQVRSSFPNHVELGTWNPEPGIEVFK